MGGCLLKLSSGMEPLPGACQRPVGSCEQQGPGDLEPMLCGCQVGAAEGLSFHVVGGDRTTHVRVGWALQGAMQCTWPLSRPPGLTPALCSCSLATTTCSGEPGGAILREWC